MPDDPTLLAPVPQTTEPIDKLTNRMEGNWLRWFRDLKLRVEALPAESLAAAEVYTDEQIVVANTASEAYTTNAVDTAVAGIESRDDEIAVNANFAALSVSLGQSRAYRITLNANVTITFFDTSGAGPFVITLVQGAGGGFTCAFTNGIYPGGVAPTLTAAAGSVDRLLVTRSGSSYLITAELDFS